MSLAYALLALLVDCPGSGYELNKAFETSIGCFWKASHQQIYRELSKLEEWDWVDAEVIPQVGKPDKKIYSVTPLGHQQLTNWVTQSCDIAPIKEEILIKLFVGDRVEPSVLQQHIRHQRQQYEERLALYRIIEAKGFSDVQNLSNVERLRYLTLRCGIRYATSWIEWCDEVLDYLKTLT